MHDLHPQSGQIRMQPALFQIVKKSPKHRAQNGAHKTLITQMRLNHRLNHKWECAQVPR